MKFWEELISYFPLLQYGPHRKQLQRFFIAAGTFLRNCYITAIKEYTDRPIDLLVQQFFFVACIFCRGNVFTEPLPNNESRDTHVDTQTDGRDL
jgi:hypothetical protein